LALAVLALVLQLMFPAGFMVAAPSAGHGIPIVICTAQGQVTVDWDGLSGGHKKQAPTKPMAGCAFAGHATTAAPPAPQAPPLRVAFAALPTTQAYAVFPGRGLAAPPPPAIGPPTRI
jgi:hypothetical protein